MDLVTFTEEILNGEHHFLCSDYGYGLKEVQVNSLMTNVPLNQLTCFYMRRFARFGTICTILKNVKNAHGGVLLLVKFQVEVWNFTKSNTRPWVFFTFLNLNKLYQTAQSVSY